MSYVKKTTVIFLLSTLLNQYFGYELCKLLLNSKKDALSTDFVNILVSMSIFNSVSQFSMQIQLIVSNDETLTGILYEGR